MALARPYDEAFERPGIPRAHYAGVIAALEAQDLAALRERVEREIERREIGFGGAPFLLDPVPRIITGQEWAGLEAGLVQRAQALNAFVADVYDGRRIVAEGIVPARVIEEAVHHEPEMRDVQPHGAPIAVIGFDVVRDEHGRFLVLEDNVRTPSGITYAIAAREILASHPPAGVREVEPALAFLGEALRAAGPVDDPQIVVLTDGDDNSAHAEHQAIATALGVPLVVPDDCEVSSSELVARIDGSRRRVDVVYRRTNEDRLRDARGRLTGIAELLLEPCRRGRLVCLNAFGVGVADDKLTHAYVEDMVRFYLDQEPLVGSVPTYDLTDGSTRGSLLERAGELVIKPRAESGGNGVVVGPHADADAVRRAVAAVEERPEEFIAQETISLSRHPTLVGDRLEPRHVDLRAFVFATAGEARAVPGGLTRVALDAGALVVNSSQGGGAKDTWVLERPA
jgi:uncharacterized circularly permuted ATP-grasp superfamily protein